MVEVVFIRPTTFNGTQYARNQRVEVAESEVRGLVVSGNARPWHEAPVYQGEPGEPGPPGPPGPRGNRMFAGVGPPTPTIPAGQIPGDVYVDASTGDIYELS